MDMMLTLIDTVGPLAAILLISVWWLSQWRTTRSNRHNPTERDLLMEIGTQLKGIVSRLEDIWRKVDS